MRRRTFIAGAGTAVAATAGCVGYTGGNEGDGVVTVATYESFVDSEESIGPWLKENFEADHDAEIEFTVPSSGINQYIRRKQEGADIDADLFVGLNVDELIRIDDELDEQLFDSIAGDLERSDRVIDELRFDPDDRAIPYDTGYISLVYDEREVEPTTFEDLTDEANRGELITQNAQESDPGLAFLLWTVHEFGADGYLDYWQQLEDNEVRILGSWSDAYNAYTNEAADMVVSYSTDQVYNGDTPRHQVGFLNDQGYAQPEGMARFADAPDADAATDFMEFMLQPEVQGVIAEKNVQFPAVDDAELDDEFASLAHVPPEPVTFGYDELAGNLDGWVDEWARQMVE
jgi:thiamine transport system substrate-binding protein